MVQKILVSKLRENPKNIRTEFDEEFIENLAESIKQFGILSPIIALKNGTVVAGNQRFRAAKKAGIKELAIGKDIVFIEKGASDRTVDLINAIENIMRRQLNVFEEAEGLRRIIAEHLGINDAVEAFSLAFKAYNSYLHEELTGEEARFIKLIQTLGISPSRAYALLSIYKLSGPAHRYLREKTLLERDRPLTISHIFQISTIQPKHQLLVAKAVFHKRLTVPGVRHAYNQWLEGLRDDQFNFKGSKKAQTEMANIHASIARRERVIKEIENRGEPTTRSVFSFAALSTDLKLLRSDIEVALKTLKSDLPMPQSEGDLVKALPFIIEDVTQQLDRLKTAAHGKTKALLAAATTKGGTAA